MWRVNNGKQVARMEGSYIYPLAASKNGKWIAAGTRAHVYVWDAKTYEQVFKYREGGWVRGVDFSPDSALLVTTSSEKAIIWNPATRKRVQTLSHEGAVIAARYSPQGDRIATATPNHVRVWDSSDGRLLVDIAVGVNQLFNKGLIWLNDHLLTTSSGKVKQFDASTGSAVSEWPVPDSGRYSDIALLKYRRFIAYSTDNTVTFWDPLTHAQLRAPSLIQHPQDVRSIALSAGDRFLAIAGDTGKIIIHDLSHINVSTMSRCFIAYLNNFLILLVFVHGSQFSALLYIPFSTNLTPAVVSLFTAMVT